MSEKTHWKKWTNPNYMGSYAFQPGEEKTLTIKEVKRELVYNPSGSGKEECTVAYFVETARQSQKYGARLLSKTGRTGR